MSSKRRFDLIIVYLCGFSCYWYLSPYGISFTDEGFFLESIQRIQAGQVPIRDFYCSYLPGRYYLGSFIICLVGDSLQSLRTVLCLLWAFLPVLVFAIIRRFFNSFISLFPVLLVMCLAGPYYNRFYMLSVLLNIWIMVRYLENPRYCTILFSGLICGLTFWIRQDVALTAFMINIFIFFFSSAFGSVRLQPLKVIQSILYFVLSWSVFVIPIIIGCFIDSSFRQGFLITFDFAVRAYYETWLLPYPEFLSLFISGNWRFYTFWELFERFLFPFQVFFIIVHVVFLIFRKSFKHRSPQFFLFQVLLVMWQLAALYYVSLRTSTTHFFMAAAPLYMSGTCLLGDAIKRIQRSNPPLIAVCFVFLPFVLLLPYSWFQGDFFSGSPGVLHQEMVKPESERIDVFMDKARAKQLSTIIQRITSRTRQNDRFITFPCFSLFNYACDRLNPSYFIWFTPEVMTNQREERIISELQAASVPYIVMMDLMIDQMEDRRFSNYAPLLHSYLIRNYVPIQQISAFGWESDLSLMKKEPGQIIVDITSLFYKTQKHDITVKGSLMIEELDLGHGVLPYLLLSPTTTVSVRVTIPSENNILLGFLSPEIASINPVGDVVGSLDMIILSDTMMINPLRIKKKVFLVRGESQPEPKMCYYDLSSLRGTTCHIIITCSGFQPVLTDSSMRVGLGYPRIIEANDNHLLLDKWDKENP